MTGAELKARRTAMGLTQEELARRLGTTQTTIWRWERDAFPVQHGEILRRALRDLDDEVMASPVERARRTAALKARMDAELADEQG